MSKRRHMSPTERARWTVHRERCRLDESYRPERHSREEGIDAVLERAVGKLFPVQESWTVALRNEWSSVVGSSVAQHTRPGRLDGRMLFVYVDSAVWLYELRRLPLNDIVARIQDRFGKGSLDAIRFVPDPGDPA